MALCSLSFHARSRGLRIWVVFILGIAGAGLGRAGAQRSNYNHAENVVRQQTAAGKIAKFNISEDPETRTIRAEILGPLLMAKPPIVTHEGVRIEGAVIKGELDLANAKIPTAVWLNNCEFLSDVDLSHTQLNGDLSLMGSHFDGDLDLDATKTDGNLILNLATIEGEFDISGSQIGGNLAMSGSAFGPNGGSIQFNNLMVAKRLDIDHVTLQRPLDLDAAESQILVLGTSGGDLSSSHFPKHNGMYSAKTINLTHATIHRELSITGLQIDTLLATGLKVEGQTVLGNLMIKSVADLRNAQFSNLALGDITWPAMEEGVQLGGLWFQYISPEAHGNVPSAKLEDGEAKWGKLSEWVDGASFMTAPYQQLEDALKREGRIDQADEIFQRREKRAWSLGGLSWQSKIKNFLLHWLVGYGREPQWAFYWSIPVIVFGWVVFRSRDFVEAKEEKNKERPFDPLWYSIDLFLPLSTLQAADVWIPLQTDKFRRYYGRVHSILGWILIPIGLAAITGLISAK
jgi:hypothetical protein